MIATIALVVLIIQILGLIVNWIAGPDEEIPASWVFLVTWPLLVPLVLALDALRGRGFFMNWRGPLTDEELQQHSSRREIYWEQRRGPIHTGFWYREVSSIRLGRWVGAGKRGGFGLTVGRTTDLGPIPEPPVDPAELTKRSLMSEDES